MSKWVRGALSYVLAAALLVLYSVLGANEMNIFFDNTFLYVLLPLLPVLPLLCGVILGRNMRRLEFHVWQVVLDGVLTVLLLVCAFGPALVSLFGLGFFHGHIDVLSPATLRPASAVIAGLLLGRMTLYASPAP